MHKSLIPIHFLLLTTFSFATYSQERSVFVGTWQGYVQYQAAISGAIVPEAHAVELSAVRIEADGRIKGASIDNGCSFLGLTKPGPINTILDVDLTLSGCTYAGLNRRYNGNIAYYKNDKNAVLSVTSQKAGGGTHEFYDIKATLKLIK